jgi:glycosyltransferase involved in cell wall biosynthesis
MKIGLFNVTATMAPIGSEEIGGVEIYTFRLAEALLERGHEVVLYGGKPGQDFELPSPGVSKKLFSFTETKQVPDLGTRFQRLIQRVHFAFSSREEFLRESCDAVIVFKPYDFLTAWLWRKWGVKSRIVASLHGEEYFTGDRFFSKAVDSLYAVSELTAGKLSGRYQQSCDVIPNFLNEKKFTTWKRTSQPAQKTIVSVGRFVEMKGMMGLLQVFARLRSQFPDIRLILVGDGPEKTKMQNWVKERGLENSVELPGVLSEDQVFTNLQKCWVYVQPSIGDESFSISTLEAFASGLSVVASDKVHIAKLFNLENAAEIYSAYNATELQQLISKVLSENWYDVQARGQRARKIVEQKYFSNQVVPAIEDLCKGSK